MIPVVPPWLQIAVPAGLCVLFLAAAVGMSWAMACLELAAVRRRSAGPLPSASALAGLLESSFVFAAAAGTVVLFLPGLGGLRGVRVPPASAARGIVLFLSAAVLLGILRAVRARPWWRRAALLSFAAAATALLCWAAWEAVDACRSPDLGSASRAYPLPEPLFLAGLAALCLLLIGGFLRLAFDTLRERRQDGNGGPLVRP